MARVTWKVFSLSFLQLTEDRPVSLGPDYDPMGAEREVGNKEMWACGMILQQPTKSYKDIKVALQPDTLLVKKGVWLET